MEILESTFSKISSVVKSQLYPFIKIRGISLLDYTFEAYFNHIVKERKIKVLTHHFSGRKIEGLTLIDKRGGISLSYEKKNPVTKQNFTKCHELGHYLLAHQGNVFTEVSENTTMPCEIEANYFSASLLMPDIVLLSKFFYQKAKFQEVARSLLVSPEALYIRLVDLLSHLLKSTNEEIQRAIQYYISGNSIEIIQLFNRVKTTIIKEYQSIEPTPQESITYLLSRTDFITNKDIPELANSEFRLNIDKSQVNIKTWAYYDKGRTIFYAWNREKLTDKQALLKAKNEYYLE